MNEKKKKSKYANEGVRYSIYDFFFSPAQSASTVLLGTFNKASSRSFVRRAKRAVKESRSFVVVSSIYTRNCEEYDTITDTKQTRSL